MCAEIKVRELALMLFRDFAANHCQQARCKSESCVDAGQQDSKSSEASCVPYGRHEVVTS